MLDYKVINNFLPKKIHKKILQTMTAGNFQWYYCDSGGNQKDKERYYFVHIFKSDKVNSDFWNPVIVPVLEKFKPKEIFRVRGNLTPRENKNYQTANHKDENFKHMVAIYYVNTNNGYTLIEDKIKVPSVANSCLFFNGNYKHRAVSQTDTKTRIIINITYL